MPTSSPRRTQAQRTAETRERLLDAAVDSLIEIGYAATSTTEVARRAGVSRGAQSHHFPTKAELVVAAIEHLFTAQARSFRAAFEALPKTQRTLNSAVDILWEIISGPGYSALLELIVAARTDAELSVVVQGIAASFEQTIRDLLAELFPDLAEVPFAADLVGFAFSLLQGAAVSDIVGFFGPTNRTIGLLRALATIEPTALELMLSGTPTNPLSATADPKEPSE